MRYKIVGKVEMVLEGDGRTQEARDRGKLTASGE